MRALISTGLSGMAAQRSSNVVSNRQWESSVARRGACMTCEHQRALKQAIRARGSCDTLRGQAWSIHCRAWMYLACCITFLVIALPATAKDQGRPSRPAIKGCTWEQLTDTALGLTAWIQRCD